MPNNSDSRMPTLFLAHGNPMHAITDDEFSRSLRRLAGEIGRPNGILVVSAHWLTTGTRVLDVEHPRTLHDFGGFPQALYEVEYPAPGSPAVAETVRGLAPEITRDSTWGLDHASWAILRHMWPVADVPVLELSVDPSLPPKKHWELGRKLASLRDDGVLIVGSGNIVHSFAGIDWSSDAMPHAWAEEFDAWVAEALVRRDHEALIEYERAGAAARRSVPTTEHYLPLLYALGASEDGDEVTFPYEGIEMASISMRCVRFGRGARLNQED